MTTYALTIRQSNQQAHIDIENDIKTKLNGLYTFTLRVNSANIVDYSVLEYINGKQKYLSLKGITIEELRTTSHNRERG